MTDHELDIDPNSQALQYRIVEHGGHWFLRRQHPEFPRTPDESVAVAEARRILPTTSEGVFVVPGRTREQLDAEPGDVVSIVAVAAARAGVLLDGFTDALEPFMRTVSEAAEAIADGFATALQQALTRQESAAAGDRDDRLPESIREARARRDQQRERERDAAGSWHPPDE
ncbi:hypothetical protein [Halosimplex pelagicum]|uniref:Uncharacterized protein n=1 Tax=Halosimplex pelagicum TaxID=869886 RepID=A0A7D5SVT1_9EURY|nr:hypothetical protein [Halosimplex pelagicum]QLH82451.1 hypothetical protein HZS54_12875 [Halosimplex pelagicum]QLH82507.1 hypothetical protein HZS54_13180 [Halosimplex pelagicum]